MDDDYDDDEYTDESILAPVMRAGFSPRSIAWNLLYFARDVCNATEKLLGHFMNDVEADDSKARERSEFASSVAAGIERL